MRGLRVAALLTFCLAPALAAQDSTLTFSTPGPKSEAIERIVGAMSRAGLVVVQVSSAGLVIGQARVANGTDGATYYAAVYGSDPVTVTWSATLGIFIRGYSDIPPIRITSTRREHGAWETLVGLSRAVSGAP